MNHVLVTDGQPQCIDTKEARILVQPIAEDMTPAVTPDYSPSSEQGIADAKALESWPTSKRARSLAATLSLEQQVSFLFRHFRGAWTSPHAHECFRAYARSIIYIAACELISTALSQGRCMIIDRTVSLLPRLTFGSLLIVSAVAFGVCGVR